MRKLKNSMGIGLLLAGATALTGCFGPKKGGTSDPNSVVFWSSFGSLYSGVVGEICEQVEPEINVKISHVQKDSYDEILDAMSSAIGVGDYPNLAMGYPDHFASYLSAMILNPIESYVDSSMLSDYYDAYMKENYFYNNAGNKKLYALPFNKSTEVLGYNGIFVDYCASLDPDLATLPETWQEWAGEKGQKYMTIFTDLIKNSRTVYGKQEKDGHCKPANIGTTQQSGWKKLLEFSSANLTSSRLMSWDATDNAFITLCRQWGATYTSLPDSENQKPIQDRQGHISFNSSANSGKVAEALRFFNRLNKKNMFGVPAELDSKYSSDAFKDCKVMFMICSSGGLSYNNKEGAWNRRFSIAPIPYYSEGGVTRKSVISQGANICMTDQGNFDDSFKVMRALTSGEFQAEFCLKTGYYPCSKSATNTEKYQNFLKETTYPDDDPKVTPTRVAYREGSQVNEQHYMVASKGWDKFVDPAFEGSSSVRKMVKGIMLGVFNSIGVGEDKTEEEIAADIEDLELYKGKLDAAIKNASGISDLVIDK